MTLPFVHSHPPVACHTLVADNNGFLPVTSSRHFPDEDELEPATAELAKQIIRQQWPKRHHPDPATREQALTLIKTHVLMLRRWEVSAA